MFKRGMILGLALAGVVAFGACSSDDDDDSNGGTSGGGDSSMGGSSTGDGGGSTGGDDSGTGGMTGGKDCSTCGKLVEGTCAIEDLDELPPGSQFLAGAIVACACQPDVCADVCGGAACASAPTIGEAACSQCVLTKCTAEITACSMDDGMFMPPMGGMGGMGMAGMAGAPSAGAPSAGSAGTAGSGG